MWFISDDINKHNHVPGMMPPEHPRRQAAVKRTLTHCLDIVNGLEYIHEKGYTHRHIKPETVLVRSHIFDSRSGKTGLACA
ncbi:hypothetical protein DPMN_136325 [Dreissena polymorpha]|uniref:Protein kinase domain-containing protein n=1 Tax=Dreissena polymorpha TaxID=45954 RepID=A0A9D4G5L7_DREPO|nr:hypothetical protein DPMN_136325 [Dreissena polymorpha]